MINRKTKILLTAIFALFCCLGFNNKAMAADREIEVGETITINAYKGQNFKLEDFKCLDENVCKVTNKVLTSASNTLTNAGYYDFYITGVGPGETTFKTSNAGIDKKYTILVKEKSSPSTSTEIIDSNNNPNTYACYYNVRTSKYEYVLESNANNSSTYAKPPIQGITSEECSAKNNKSPQACYYNVRTSKYEYVLESTANNSSTYAKPPIQGITSEECSAKNNESTTNNPDLKVKRPDNVINGLGDPTPTPVPTPSGQTFQLDADNEIDGQVCSHFEVCAGTMVSKAGGFLSNQNAFVYPTSSKCINDSNSYTAFCLDPGRDGVYAGCLAYSASPLDLNTNFGKRMYALYRIFKQNGGCSSDQCVIEYQSAARLLQYQSDSQYSPNSSANTRLASHASAYLEAWDAGKIGGVGGTAISLASQAVSSAESLANEAKASSIGISAQQLGVFDYTSDTTYTTKLSVTVQNYERAKNNISGFNESHPFKIKVITNEETQEGSEIGYTVIESLVNGNDLVYTIEISGSMNTGECEPIHLSVEMPYTSLNDISHAYIISPSDPARSEQTFAVFAEQTSEATKSSDLFLNPGNCDKETDDKSCKASFTFVCAEDGQEVLLDEVSSPEDWENCIINGHDAQGNSYDIISTANREYNEEYEGQGSVDNILAYLSDGTKITSANYCTISCKESYTFSLPGEKKDIKQGRYFEFNVNGPHYVVGVGAQRQCVTTEMANEEFSNIILDLRKQQVDYYNMYSYYKAIYKKMNEEKTKEIYKNPDLQPPIPQKPTISTTDGWTDPDFKESLSEFFKENYMEPEPKYFYEFWNGYDIQKVDISDLEIPFYYMEDPSDLDTEIKELEGGLKIDRIDRSFRQATIGKNNVNLDNYSRIYPDYAIFDEVMNVAKNVTSESGTYYYKVTERRDDSCSSGGDIISCGSVQTECHGYHDSSGNCVGTTHNYYNATVRKTGEYTVTFQEISENMREYDAMLERIESAYTKAYEKFVAITKQINAQADSIQQCANYLNTLDKDHTYTFNPDITFTYDQDNYMAQMSPNKLVPVDGKINDPSYELFYCNSAGNAASVFGCNDGSEEKADYNFLLEFEDSGKGGDVVKPEKDLVEYYNVQRVGSQATYNMQYFWNNTKFYTYPPDGIVTTDPNATNATIIAGHDASGNEFALDDDAAGRVYPITITTQEGIHNYSVSFRNIGQYFEKGSLGRLMGGSSISAGVYSGEMQDTHVCTYEVCRIDDPTCGRGDDSCIDEKDGYCDPKCPNDPDCGDCKDEKDGVCDPKCPNDPDCTDDGGVCKEKLKSATCNNGAYSRLTPTQVKECINMLINENCCTEATLVKNANLGKVLNKDLPDYVGKCLGQCTSFNIVNYTGNIAASNYSDLVDVDNDGQLQFTVRHVSTNNLFPNGVSSKGANWMSVDGSSSKAADIISDIESKGESIYGGNREYGITLTPACAAKIRDYNNQQDSNNSGGYDDYTNMIDNSNLGEAKAGSIAVSVNFKDFLASTPECKYDWSNTPDIIPENNK